MGTSESQHQTKQQASSRQPSLIAGAIIGATRVIHSSTCPDLVAYREILMPVIEKLKGQEKKMTTVKCDRNLIFETAMSIYKEKASKQRSSSVNQKLQTLIIVFTSNGKKEPAIDANGLRREFYSTFFKHVISGDHVMFEGNGRRLLPRSDADLIENQGFQSLGIAVVESILNGDCGFPYLHPSVFHYIFGNHNYEQHLCIDDVPDFELREQIEKISRAKDTDSILEILNDLSIFDHTGWPVRKAITIENKHVLVQHLIKWNIIDKRLAAIEQLREGLRFLGFLPAMKEQSLIEPLFIFSEEYSITANYLQKRLIPVIEKKTTKNKEEMKAKAFALDAIKSLNDDQARELYTFITNLMDPPVQGEDLSVSFNTGKPRMKYPLANVCNTELIIPLGNKTLNEFKHSFVTAVTEGSEYGRV